MKRRNSGLLPWAIHREECQVRVFINSDNSRLAPVYGNPHFQFVVARKPAIGVATSWAFWDSWASGGSGTTPDLRAMSFLALPGPSALLVYRDRTAFRCIDFSPSLNVQWTRHVRGASLQVPSRVRV